MTRNLYKLWLVLLIVSGGIALWFSCIASVELWKFFRLNADTPATISHWGIRDLSSSCFAIEAHYIYEIKGVVYSGKTILEKPQFLNRFAAENHMKQLEAKRWQAWYKESKPSLSNLEREFPQKKCLQALLTLGVFIYFYFARSMLSRLAS